METKRKGDICEQLVADKLAGEGHVILARNYRCRYGEIDVLSLSDKGVLCVTEVKSLTGRWPSEDIMYMVSPQKRMRLRKTLEYFLSSSDDKVHYKSIRFDVAAVTGGNVTFYRGDDF
ncbi:MAG: YraN family protein [bacterium]|jgi:putative endonuclease|nr:YraN family protein [Spirochaetales bacterium]MDT3389234.1 YraN family protein [bacterium]